MFPTKPLYLMNLLNHFFHVISIREKGTCDLTRRRRYIFLRLGLIASNIFVIVEVCNSLMLVESLYYTITKLLELDPIEFCHLEAS